MPVLSRASTAGVDAMALQVVPNALVAACEFATPVTKRIVIFDVGGQCVSGVGRYEGQPILITEAKVRRRGYWYRFRGRNDQHAERADE